MYARCISSPDRHIQCHGTRASTVGRLPLFLPSPIGSSRTTISRTSSPECGRRHPLPNRMFWREPPCVPLLSSGRAFPGRQLLADVLSNGTYIVEAVETRFHLGCQLSALNTSDLRESWDFTYMQPISLDRLLVPSVQLLQEQHLQ